MFSHVLKPFISALKITEDLDCARFNTVRAEDIEAKHVAMALGEVPCPTL
jgi:hypothetical protein